MTDYHINIFYGAEVERAKSAWLAAACDGGKPIPEPRYRPVIYQVRG